jgi:hypothetical protein
MVKKKKCLSSGKMWQQPDSETLEKGLGSSTKESDGNTYTAPFLYHMY